MIERADSEYVLPEFYGLDMYITEVSENSLLSPQQKLALINLVIAEDPDTKRQLIVHNLRLVINIAKRYSVHGVALLDLVMVGNQGLIHALENFKLEGGFRFATYAAKCVRHSIESFIMNQKNNLSFAA